jgi:hypothetical protein
MKINSWTLLIGAPLMVSVLTACPDRREPEPQSQFIGYWMNESALTEYKKSPSDRAFCPILVDGYDTHLADFEKNESLNVFFIDQDGATYQVDRTFLITGRPTPQRLIGRMDRDGAFKTESVAPGPSNFNFRTRSSVFARSWHELSRFIRTGDSLILESTTQNNRSEILAYHAVDVRDVKRYSEFIQGCMSSEPNLKARFNSRGAETDMGHGRRLPPVVSAPPPGAPAPPPGVGVPGAGGKPPARRDYDAEYGEEGSPYAREEAARNSQANGRNPVRSATGPSGGGRRQPPPRVAQPPPDYDGPDLNPVDDEFRGDSRNTYPGIIQPQSR